jgi:hypothetical protein
MRVVFLAVIGNVRLEGMDKVQQLSSILQT